MRKLDKTMGKSAYAPNFTRSLRDFAQSVDRAVGLGNSYRTIGPISVFRAFEPLKPMHVLCTPLLCVVAQGRKEVVQGDRRYVYEPGQIFLNSLPVPTESATIAASKEEPCLWMTLDLQSCLVSSVVAEAGLVRTFAPTPLKTMETAPLELSVLKALGRLADLFETPAEAVFLAPLIIREIVYRLLVGEQGARLRQVAFADSPPHPVLRAVAWLNENFSQPLVVQQLAQQAGMSPSSLHQHFKAVTALSPAQYQRRMRLHEALRLMLKEELDVANAGYRVGYEDPSHFNREYRRFFGAPPRRHVESLRRGGSYLEAQSPQFPPPGAFMK